MTSIEALPIETAQPPPGVLPVETLPSAEQDKRPLAERSAENIATIEDSYMEQAVKKGQFASREDAQAALSATEAAVAETHHLVVTMSAESFDRFMTVGHAETMWDHLRELGQPVAVLGGLATANGKHMHDEYTNVRRIAEGGLREYAPASSNRHEPIYAAVTDFNTDDRQRGDYGIGGLN